MNRLLGLLLVVVSLPCGVGAKEIKLRGYVTRIISPTAFEIEDYRITRDLSLVLEFEKDEEGGNVEFQPDELRVGTLLEIKGDYDENTGELRAKSIRVILEDFKRIKRTALIERAPALNKTESGWDGIFFADGQRIQVNETTQVLFKLNKSERKALKEKEKREKKGLGPEQEEDAGHPMESIDQIGPNTFMAYEGVRQPDGSILASRVQFMRNELEKGEAKFWQSLKVSVKPPKYAQAKPGELKIAKIGKFKLVPSEEAQKYLRELGERLIPEHQRALSENDPNKIHFQFFLVQAKVANAFATPNGIIVVFSPMFSILENEAQLAAVLGHEISHTIQEHTWREHEYHRKKLMALKVGAIIGSVWGGQSVLDIANMIEGAVRNGYSRALENQADRAGLGYALAAGYDIREAPRVWKLMTREYGDRSTNLFWSSHDNNTTRRSYLMAELRINYADVDYERLEKNGQEFERIAQLVLDATKKKQKVKVKY